MSSNPIKPVAFIQAAHAAGLDRFAVDSRAELVKLAHHAPGSRVYVRLTVDNSGSEWPLAKKYGASAADAVQLLREARAFGLRPYGLTFHVGSQCLDKESWTSALLLCHEIWRELAAEGIALVGDAGLLVASVIGTATRGQERWLYLDAGVFNALLEAIQGFRYQLRTERAGPPRHYVLAGPSCDSVDTISQEA